MMNHRESWAIEKKAPSKDQWIQATLDPSSQKAKRKAPEKKPIPQEEKPRTTKVLLRRGGETRIKTQSQPLPQERATPPTPSPQNSNNQEVLVVASKLKAYIREKSGMSTSDGVLKALSHHIRRWADEAIISAQRNERKTVLDRDF